jgi:hypothetical protein
MNESILCKYNFHKWEKHYDPMYDEHKRVCVRCDKKQYANMITLSIKYQDGKPKRRGFNKKF